MSFADSILQMASMVRWGSAAVTATDQINFAGAIQGDERETSCRRTLKRPPSLGWRTP
jgi:hypothetical protein